MNRRERRAYGRDKRGKSLQWGKVLPQGSYDDLGDNDGRDLLMQVFRAVAQDACSEVFDDRNLFNSTMTLIQHGLLNVWFAVDAGTIHVRSELTPPAGGAA